MWPERGPLMSAIEVVLDAKAALGESPTWSPREAALYWIDVRAPALHRFDPATGEQRHWALTSDVGAFTLRDDLSGALVALRTGLYDLDFASGGLTLRAPAPFDPAIHRFNEGGCDPSGRFWAGVMFDPLDPAAERQAGALQSYTPAEGLQQAADVTDLHNGMAWSADGRQMFLCHSQEGVIYRFDVAGRQLSGRALFARVPEADGVPDGAAIDTEGGYWCAVHGGSRLRRFTATGAFDRDIMLPVSKPTMCAFGGAELDTLYVTSAAEDLTPEQLRAEPHAGALLRLMAR